MAGSLFVGLVVTGYRINDHVGLVVWRLLAAEKTSKTNHRFLGLPCKIEKRCIAWARGCA